MAGLGLQYVYNCILKDSNRGDDDDVEGMNTCVGNLSE